MCKLGWKANRVDEGLSGLLECTIAADGAGFDLLDASEHFKPDQYIQVPALWAWLGAAAVKTRRIILGAGVSLGAVRADPVGIAQAAQSLFTLSLGRSYLSIGTGELNPGPHPLLDELEPKTYELQNMVVESASLLRRLWTGNRVTFVGTYFKMLNAAIHTGCDASVPLYIPSYLPGNAHFAGYYGDGLITTGGRPLYFYRRMLQEFESGARKAGKDPERMERSIELDVAYPEQEHEKLTSIHTYRLYGQGAPSKNGKRYSVQAVEVAEVKAASCAPFTSSCPDDHASFLQQYIDAGFTNLIVRSDTRDQVEFIKRYGREVLPLVRERNSPITFADLRLMHSEAAD